ncbi:MAG: hypothetical protein MUF15_17295 [Acidobacteria bacterium]|jgi:hypothetical protein|nr:hypothetical protein [Acidobacteriota bacterium]
MNKNNDTINNIADSFDNAQLPSDLKKAQCLAKIQAIQHPYWIHMTAARIIFKNDLTILNDLDIKSIHCDSIISWSQQARDFYHKILYNDEILKKIATFGITREELESVFFKLKELEGNKYWKKYWKEKMSGWLSVLENDLRETYKDDPEKLAKWNRLRARQKSIR